MFGEVIREKVIKSNSSLATTKLDFEAKF